MTTTPQSAVAQVLVIDDEPDLRELYELTLMRAGYRIHTAGSVTAAKHVMSQQAFDAIITDMRLSDGLGLEILQELQSSGRPERAIVITAYGSAENEIAALRAGAFDYISKPVDLQRLRDTVAAAIAERQSRPAVKHGKTKDGGNATLPFVTEAGIAQLASQPSAMDAASLDAPTNPALIRIVGDSAAMVQLREHITRAARGMAPVLIRGESGTGKELAAQAIHACSQRAQGPFIAVNCGAIPENLLEAEFFGARKGSYTGATADREGYFQAANGGTLFLDELGDLPLPMQAKLLRAIQERKVRPLGSTKEEAVDVRLVSATHHDLAQAVHEGRFRQDLYYRLNVIELVLPPLRERREDIPKIAAILLQKIAKESGLVFRDISLGGMQALQQLPLKGNVRELENILQRALAMSDGAQLQYDDFSSSHPASLNDLQQAEEETHLGAEKIVSNSDSDMLRGRDAHREATFASLEATASSPAPDISAGSQVPAHLPHNLPAYLDNIERSILLQALKENRYNRTATAARLGITLRQIRYRMQQLQIDDGKGND